ncbi:hypothetical protein BDZ45DRAFT_750534 [Acephala macrosclerotiorum]|nr:hypothetical protein BDZ45DRAFT_750534 [Acephala macrosclerotiorum]
MISRKAHAAVNAKKSSGDFDGLTFGERKQWFTEAERRVRRAIQDREEAVCDLMEKTKEISKEETKWNMKKVNGYRDGVHLQASNRENSTEKHGTEPAEEIKASKDEDGDESESNKDESREDSYGSDHNTVAKDQPKSSSANKRARRVCHRH